MRAINIILLIVLACNLSSCNKKETRDKSFISPLDISVSTTLTEGSEVSILVNTLEKRINEISDEIETIAIEGETLISKDELEIIEGLEVVKTMLNFYSSNADLHNTIEEFEEYISIQEELGEINSLELEALSLVKLELINRVEQLEQKYPIYYNR